MGNIASALSNLGVPLIAAQIIVLIAIVIVVLGLLTLSKGFFQSVMNKKNNEPMLLKGSKNAKNSLVISQDPKEEGAITLYRSHEEDKGIEFSYSMWLLIDNFTYKTGEWKHILHKGNDTGYPNRAPGLYLHPDKNSIRFYMNTYENILEYVDIDNIPMRKWLHVVVSLNQKNLDIYFNGYLRKRHELSSLPRQNFGDVWMNLFGGFEGYMSNVQYFRYALSHQQVENIVRSGPSKDACGDSGEMPPYLDDSWWYDF
jgi:hypothetical protein